MTIEDYCISLNPNNFFLVVLGVVDMCHDLLKVKATMSAAFRPQFSILNVRLCQRKDHLVLVCNLRVHISSDLVIDFMNTLS